MNIGHDERVIKALKTSLLFSFFGGRVVRPDQTQDFYNQLCLITKFVSRLSLNCYVEL